MKKSIYLLLILVFFIGCSQEQTPISKKQTSQETSQAVQSEVERLAQDGIDYLGKGNVSQAIRTFDDTIRKNPRNPHGYIILGQLYIYLKNYDRALDTLSTALKLNPNNGSINYWMAVAYDYRGDPDLAVQYAQKSVEIFENNQDQESFMGSLVLLRELMDAPERSEGISKKRSLFKK